MISRIARLRAKKGFTMIEIIVVVAIIGILAAMVIPALTYDNRPTQGKGIAKELYYRSQDVFSSVEAAKSSCPEPVAIADGKTVIFYADLDRSGKVTSCGRLSDGYIKMPFPDDITGASHQALLDRNMKTMFENALTSFDGMEGSVYIAVDSEYRSLAAFWTDDPASENLKDSVFTDDCVTDDGYYCSAYPVRFCVPGIRPLVDLD